MTISLLRRIWRRIISDTVAAPRQRLTGFEYLEPRMVLSGMAAFLAPDYLSPPSGDFSDFDRLGAEIARPSAEFHWSSDYTALAVPMFDHPAGGDGRFGGRGNDNWLDSPRSKCESNCEIGGGSPLETITIINVPVTPDTSIDFISISPIAVDSILRSMTASFSFAGATSMSTLSTNSSVSGGYRSLTDRDYNQVNSGGAVQQQAEEHAHVALPSVGATDASLALTARAAAATERSATDAALSAALANQSGGTVNSLAVPGTDGSAAQGQANPAANNPSDNQQDLLELTDAERLKLKRKLPGSATEVEEATNSSTARSDHSDESDFQVSYDPSRPFNAAMSESSLSPIAGANLADDGLIEVLATDVTVTLASNDVIGNAATNRQIVMEPAVATYQAFDIVADGDGKPADVVAVAARLAGAVAMSAPPVVQAE